MLRTFFYNEISNVLHVMSTSWTSLAHDPSKLGMPPLHLSLGSLVLSPSHFKSSLKLIQWTLLTAMQRSFSPLRQVYPICWQQAQCHVDQPMIKKPKILPMTPGSQPGTDLLVFPVSSLIISCNWKHSEHYFCFWSLNLLSQGPEVSPDSLQASCFNFTIAYMKNQ